MNPVDILFASVSSLTGGLITDMTTAMVAIVCLSFLLMGFDILRDIIEGKIMARRKVKEEIESYQKYTESRERRDKFAATYSAEHDFVGPIAPTRTGNSSSKGYF